MARASMLIKEYGCEQELIAILDDSALNTNS